MAVAWLGLWVLGAVWFGVAVPRTNAGNVLSPAIVLSGIALGVAAAILLASCGYLLARSRRWVYLWMLVGYVWALSIMLYVVAMLATPVAGGSDSDTAAGAGVVILGIPMLLVVGTVAGIGAVVSLIVGRLSDARRTSSAG